MVTEQRSLGSAWATVAAVICRMCLILGDGRTDERAGIDAGATASSPIRFERANPGPLLSVYKPQRTGYAAFELYQSIDILGEQFPKVEPLCEVLILLFRPIHSAPRLEIRRFG